MAGVENSIPAQEADVVDFVAAKAVKEQAQAQSPDAVFDAVADELGKLLDSASKDDPRALAVSHLFASVSAHSDLVQAQIALQEAGEIASNKKELEDAVQDREKKLAKVFEVSGETERRFAPTSEPAEQIPTEAGASTKENPYIAAVTTLQKELLPKLFAAQAPITRKRLSAQVAANEEAVQVLTLGDAAAEVYNRIGKRAVIQRVQKIITPAPMPVATPKPLPLAA